MPTSACGGYSCEVTFRRASEADVRRVGATGVCAARTCVPELILWRKLLGCATGVCCRPGKLSAQNKNFERAPNPRVTRPKSTTTRGQPERGTPRDRTQGSAVKPRRPRGQPGGRNKASQGQGRRAETPPPGRGPQQKMGCRARIELGMDHARRTRRGPYRSARRGAVAPQAHLE